MDKNGILEFENTLYQSLFGKESNLYKWMMY